MTNARKEMVVGVLFAIAMAIFINYSSIDRIMVDRLQVSAELLYPLTFSLVWCIFTSLLFYIYYVAMFNILSRRMGDMLLLLPTFVGALILGYALSELYPYVRDFFAPDAFIAWLRERDAFEANRALTLSSDGVPRPPRGGGRWIDATLFKHLLILVLNMLFVYIQRLLYTNQAIARRNEQLQLETVKSQHKALLQQINPHFFFNSLNSLRYIINKGDSESAVEYLDNLITIFRKTLKASSNTLHTLSEELAITTSYAHIIERRFNGKFAVDFAVNTSYSEHLIAPLTLLTLVENAVKHNTISAKEPMRVKIFSTADSRVVVENNIVPQFEEVESSGIGLKNLSLQYELLASEAVVIDNSGGVFRVTLPLIETKV